MKTTMDWVQMFMQYDTKRKVSIQLKGKDGSATLYRYTLGAEMAKDPETGEDWLDVTLTATE